MSKELRFEMRLDKYHASLLYYMSSECNKSKSEFLCDLLQKYYDDNFKESNLQYLNDNNSI